jgi:hypothetical protein
MKSIKTKILQLLPAILLILLQLKGQAQSDDNTITPDAFNWMSKTSINIKKTYDSYRKFIEEYDPLVLFDVNTIQAEGYNYLVPSSLGDLSVGPIQLEMAMYYRWQTKKKLKLGFFAFINTLDLQIDEELHPTLRDIEGPYGDLYGWQSGKMILATSATFNPNVEITLGALVTQAPYVTLANDGTEQFDIIYDEEEDEYLASLDKNELFFIGTFYGYQFGTFYEFSEREFSLIELKRSFNLSSNAGEIDLGLRHYSFKKTYQAGIEYHNPNLLSVINVDFESYWNIYKNNQWNDLGYIMLSSGVSIFKNKQQTEIDRVKKDFFIDIMGGVSYSKDIFNEGLTGYSCTVNFIDIWGWWHSFKVGYSHNYFDDLNRLPLKNEHGIIVAFRFMVKDFSRLKKRLRIGD